MATEYRDFGRLNDNPFKDVRVEENHRNQIFRVTHVGEERLPYMERAFISFSFGGKWIEDFDLIASINGNSYQYQGYANFEDIVSNYDLINGHQYWGTRFTDHDINFRLATDGITEIQLNEFLNWFSPGYTRELILAEHPNRAIMARVKTPPELNVLTFKEKVVKKMANQEYQTYTTLYKGYINLSLTMEEPYWYSKINVFGYVDSNNTYQDTWTDAAGHQNVSIYTDKDAIKIALEDNIPMSNMISDTLLFGDNKYADATERSTNAKTAPNKSYSDSEWQSGQLQNTNYVIATVESNGNWISGARIGGVSIVESTGATINKNDKEYFYYGGTAPSYPKIKFTMAPKFDNNCYIVAPIDPARVSSGNLYNTIVIKSIKEKKFTFIAPSIYTSYNQVIKIFSDMQSSNNWVDIQKKIREQVFHFDTRAWANKVIDGFLRDSNNQLTYNTVQETMSALGKNLSSMKLEAKNRMKCFLAETESVSSGYPSTYTFDSKTGEAKGEIQHRHLTLGYYPQSLSQFYNFPTEIIEEDVGDMVRSNYLVIEDRNYPTAAGTIEKWSNSNEISKRYSHYITHDVDPSLSNFFINYKNMYL